MSTPLAAVSRLDFRYRSYSRQHRLSTYVAYNNVLGAHQLNDRDGITTILWTLAAQYLWDKVRAIYDGTNTPSAASVTLLDRVGTLWHVTDVAALTGIGSGGGQNQAAQQFTWVLRDTAFKKLRFITLESNGGYLYHTDDGCGAGAGTDAISNMLNGVDTNANAPFRWMKSRGDHFLAASGTIAGFTADLNDKIKRAAGQE